MNHFSYDVFSKEKLNNFREEGLRNQAVYKSRLLGIGISRSLLKLILVLAVILGVLVLVIR